MVKLNYNMGTALPLGVTRNGRSVNMSIVAPNCKSCRIHFFSKNDKKDHIMIDVPEQYQVGDICCIAIEGLDVSKFEYVYEIDNKIVIDPYAQVIIGKEKWGKFDQYFDPYAVRCGFAEQNFDWKKDKPLTLPYQDMILYKMHVRGFTKHYSSSCGKVAGTYRGVIEKIPYLKDLGINAILLMPIVEFNEILIDDSMSYYMEQLNSLNYKQVDFVDVAKSGNVYEDDYIHDTRKDTKMRIPYRINYWGYSKQNYYFAPKAAYASNPSDAMNELKSMVYELHKAGIEVLMEFNFTKEMTQQTILDCLHYWYFTYHIDGFSVNNNVVATQLLASDPVLAKTKLLATAWDDSIVCKETKHRVRKNLAECNDAFLVDTRRYLKGDEEQVASFAFRMKRNPIPYAVINYITNNNGFTLHDLVSYDIKHNFINGEENKDGTDYNYSWNCGIEGKTTKKKVIKLRRQQIRNAFIMLLLSQGTPMLLMGDEFGNSQGGNNNAYCQDNITSWLNWVNLKQNADLYDMVKELIHIRKTKGFCGKEEEYKMTDVLSCGCPDMSYHGTKAWYPDFSNYSRVFGVMFSGSYLCSETYYYIAYNMHWEQHEFDLPRLPEGQHWKVWINTDEEDCFNTKTVREEYLLDVCLVPPRSILVLCSESNLE